MKILLVSGIWPPDVGGPASHGPEFGRFLVARGHEVRAVTSADTPALDDPGFPLTVARRDRPRPVRLSTGALAVTAAARHAEVIYATGFAARSAIASALHRVPLVLKVVSDPAYERARTLGLFSGSLEEFQQHHGGRGIEYLKRLRGLTLRRPSRIVIPSEYLAEIARAWGVRADRISVIPNPAPPVDRSTPREVLRDRLGIRRPTFVFAGRLVSQKNLPLAVSAIGKVPGASLVLVGDGPLREPLARMIAESGVGDRVSIKGAVSRDEAIDWLRAADAAVLPSDWENFPHAAVEALAAGTPVVATSVGGVPEIIQSQVNGILVSRGDAEGFASAMTAVASDPARLQSLRDGAEASGGRYTVEAAFGELEAQLIRAARR